MRHVEARVERLGQHVEDLDEDVRGLAPLGVLTARIEERMAALEGDVRELGVLVAGLRQALEDRDRSATQERRAVRVALIGLTGVILAALISGIAAVLAAGIT